MTTSVALPAGSWVTAVLRAYLPFAVPISRNASRAEAGTKLAVMALSVARPKISETLENSARDSGRTYSPWKVGPRALELSSPPPLPPLPSFPFFSCAEADGRSVQPNVAAIKPMN